VACRKVARILMYLPQVIKAFAVFISNFAAENPSFAFLSE
jgi:hypothetical protein